MSYQAPDTAVAASASKKKSMIAATAGNILEWYEWSAYAVFAPFIAQVVFEPSSTAAGILATFGVFAVSFLFRPLGGILFGWLADRKGRKFVLVFTMLMMAGGSLIIGIMPTYHTAGVWSAVILLAARVIQGFAHGGESATSTTYVAEIAPPARRGLWSSVVHIAIVGGSVLAYGLGAVITTTFGDQAVLDWAWRVPFLIGAVAALGVLYLRRHMDESDVFEDDTSVENSSGQVPEKISAPAWGRRRTVLVAVRMILFTAGITAVHYTWSSYISTYAISSQGMDPSTAYWVSLVAQCIVLVSLPLFGMLSDRIGRRPQVLVFAVASAILVMPLTAMVGDVWWTLLVPQTVALCLWALASSIFAAMQAENFPTHMRTRGIGFAYSMGVAVFGGTAPYLNQLFVGWGTEWVFHVYIMVLCLFTLLTTLMMRETRGIDLRDVDAVPANHAPAPAGAEREIDVSV
ncbi:MFS transporter [Micrococcus sp. TA1]|uniref:MFS transporter n=1 Tax=Micrococcus sp. TA1 TaxID=681627 RepID=UPI00161DB3C8|nr:MFS transporter [Micrococcus sp. TA1]MBB5748015.1 MHS family alpha-ketoglutarate permease-like MFS transporter [Micrococcus sp. TA1]